MESWQTPCRNYHPGLRDPGVKYVLEQLIRTRKIVHAVLSLPEFGLGQHIRRTRVPVASLHPRYERFTCSGLVLVMTKRWPLEIQHPFGCQHFDGGYYFETPEVPQWADDVLARLAERGLRLEQIEAPESSSDVALLGCTFYAVRGVGDEEGQRLEFNARLWAQNGVWPASVVQHYRRAMAAFGIAG